MAFWATGGTAALLAAGIFAISYLAKTGSQATGPGLGANTWVQIILVAIGVVACIALVLRGAPGPAYGRGAFGLFAALAVLTAVSIAWSVAPDESWVEAARTTSYLAAFGTALVLARLLPSRWQLLPTAIALGSIALSAWALVAKVFTLHVYFEGYGRLLAPFNYWNATGLAAAIGLPVVIWLGSRRERTPLARALAVPGIALLLTVVILSYSRSAVAAAVIGTAVPLFFGRTRLRACVPLGLGAVAAAIICGWALHDNNLTGDAIPQAARAPAGHTFGLVLVVVLVIAGVAGWLGSARLEQVSLSERSRRRIGTALWGVVALIPVIILLGLAASSRGFTGEISHIWSTLTSTTSSVGTTSARLGQLDSSRPAYWHSAISVGNHHLLAGTGAGGFGVARWRYQSAANLPVDHAHGYAFQTYADFGLIGIALNLALLVAWLRSAGVTLERWRRPAGSEGERNAVWALLGVVAAFAVSSAIDWTWFAPGVALPALLSAGWIAGRGPLSAPIGMATSRDAGVGTRPLAILATTGVVILGIAVAWETWQPLRSQNAVNAGISAQAAGDSGAALGHFRTAVNAFPVSLTAIRYLAGAYLAAGDHAAARREFVHGTTVHPQNACAWMYLGQFEYTYGDRTQAAAALARASALNVTTVFTPTTPACPQST